MPPVRLVVRVPLLADRAEQVCGAQDLVGFVGGDAEVVQVGSDAAGEGDVVDGLFAVHPGRVPLECPVGVVRR